MSSKPAKSRLDFLRQLLDGNDLSTQEELVEKLERSHFTVTQSTVSRDLRKLGAIRTVDSRGRTVYRLPGDMFAPVQTSSLSEMVTSIRSNGSMIVIRTHPGSASLVGRFVDMTFTGDILGSIAGDDTVFIAPGSLRETHNLMKQIEKAIREGQRNT
jgi:transcriptional regulator of arginine metabolism